MDAVKEVIWLRGLAEDLGVTLKTTALMYNNQGAGCLSVDEGLHRSTKHIYVRHHFIRDCVISGKVKINYVPTSLMLANILTKPLEWVKHPEAVEMVGLV